MFRSRLPERARSSHDAAPQKRRAARLVTLSLGLLLLGTSGGCDSLQQAYTSSFHMMVTPAPPVAGEPMVLVFNGRNVGLIRVYQDDQELASYVNATVDGSESYQLLAVSDSMPTAIVDGVNGGRHEVTAEPAWGFVPTPEPNPDGTPNEPEPEPGFPESCPDEAPVGSLCTVIGTENVRLRVRAEGYTSVSGYLIEETCTPSLVTIITENEVWETDHADGAVFRFIDDATAEVIRDVRLGATPCDLVLVAP